VINLLKSIEKNEVLPVTLLFLHSFLNGLALVYFEATANTLFLINYNVSELPYIYIFTAITSVILGYFYTKLEQNLNIKKLLSITLLVASSIIIAFFLAIKLAETKLLFMLIMIFKDIMWIFVGIEFGVLMGLMFNIRQGKRLFGIVMSGEILAGILGGLSIGFIIDMIDTINLLLISFFTLVLSFILLLKIFNQFSHKFKDDDYNEEYSKDDNISYLNLLKNRYYILFFIVSILAFFVFYFIDFAFYYKVEENYTNEKDLVSFFGIFFAMLSVVNLVSSLFVSGAVLSRFGILFGLLAIPAMAILGTSSLFVVSSISIAFIVIVTIKLFNEVFDISVLTPTFRILYQVIPLKQRVKVLAFRETIIEPVAMGAAGLLLLLFASLDGIETVYYVIAIASFGWLFFARLLKSQYINSLEKMVDKRVFYTDDILFDGVNEEVLVKGLSTDNEIQILYYLNLLERFSYDDLKNVLITLISHKSENIRKSILEKLNTLNSVELLNTLHTRMENESSQKVFPVLIMTYCHLGGEQVVNKVLPYLESENINIKSSTIVGLLNFCGRDSHDMAKELMNRLFQSNISIDKKVFLLVLEEVGINNFYNQFIDCMKSDEEDIRKLAIEIVGKLHIIELVPLLLANLNSNKFKNSAIYALIEFGDEILLQVQDLFNTISDLSNQLIIVKILGKMNSEKANDFLIKLVHKPLLKDSVLEALFHSNYIVEDTDIVNNLLIHNSKSILRDLIILSKLDKQKYPNTYLVFKELVDVKVNNIFLILGFSYSKKTLSQVLFFSKSSTETKSYAIELIDNLLPINLKKIILPILDEISIEQKLRKYSNDFIDYKYNEEEFFSSIINDKEVLDILKVSLIYEIGKSQDRAYIDLVKTNLMSDVFLIQETTQWAFSQLNKKV